jgi:predicted nucleic acid-binding protein
MIQTVVFDTSALISLLSDNDSRHQQAVTLAHALRQTQQTLVIPTEVLAEALNVLRPRLGNEATAAIGTELLTAPDFAVTPTPRLVLQLTLAKLRKQTGDASYIDCLVIAAADHYKTDLIFGFDDTFRKNGYGLPGERRAA